MLETHKSKSVEKIVLASGPALEKAVSETLSLIAKIVGGTLGPGGRPVLIERQEYNLPPKITKDGVTVFQSLGFMDSVSHCLMESMRDTAVRTANEAGDGTTTATILAHAFRQRIAQFCKDHPEESPQSVVRSLKRLHTEVLQPALDKMAITCSLDADDLTCFNVAKISANGDEKLAEAVLTAYDICGDEGNVNIVEVSGPYGYQVEKIEGYPILNSGFEHSCSRFYPVFVNDAAKQRVIMDKPAFVLYFGSVSDLQTIRPVLMNLYHAWKVTKTLRTHNVVLMAQGFSDSVLGSLAEEWADSASINVFPYVLPRSPFLNGQKNMMDDIAAVVGAKVFDQVTNPLDENTDITAGIGNVPQQDSDSAWLPVGITHFECKRYDATILGRVNDPNGQKALIDRVEEVQASGEFAESELEKQYQRERAAKLSGGIARLKVLGSSNGEMKERADRADDAVCAVKGALQHGALPGGCRALIDLSRRGTLGAHDERIWVEIIAPALLTPFRVLLENTGYRQDEIEELIGKMLVKCATDDSPTSYDVLAHKFVDAKATGLLDSFPAVSVALRTSLSIASELGTLGGIIVHPRDKEFDRKDAVDAADFNRMISTNMADERI